jgi:hypothetical protein
MESFMSQLYRLGAATLFDAAALHPYAATPDDVLRLVAELRALMRLFGDAGKPIWITEAGWASGGTASALTVDPERLGIVGVVWYSLRDMPGPFWPGHCELFRAGRKDEAVLGGAKGVHRREYLNAATAPRRCGAPRG